MSKLFFTGRSPIGLDIGRCALRAVQLGGGKGKRAVVASARIGRTHPDEPIDQAELLRLWRVLSQQGFTGRKVVLAAPAEKLMTAVLDVPPLESGAPYGLIVSQEFARLNGQAPGGFETSWWPVPQPVRVTSDKVMAVGCLNADTDPLLTEMQACRYDVVGMDFGLCALARSCADQLGSAQALSALLDIGWGSTRLALIHQSVVVFDRTFPGSGMHVLQERVCQSLDIEPVEADCLLESVGLSGPADGQPDARVKSVLPLLRPLVTSHLDEIAKDVEVSFEYASHQYPDAKGYSLVLAGGGGAVPGAAEYLDTRLDLDVRRAEAGALLTERGERANLSCGTPLMATAVGLAGYYDG
jgi:type IV pilus assembly protein PilM